MQVGTPEERTWLLAAAIDSAATAVVTKTLEGVITSWNKAAEGIFGYSADDVIGRHISLLFPPEKGFEETRILQTVARGEVFGEIETTRLRKDGTQVDVAVTISPIRDAGGRVVGASKFARELTSLRVAEQSAQVEREQMRITLSSIADGILVTDEQGRVTFLNPTAEQLTGWTLAQAKGQTMERVFHIISEKTRRRAENPVPKVLQEGLVLGLANHTVLISKDGTERSIDDSAAPIRRADGTISGAVLVFRDVSQQRAAEEMRARLAAIVESSDDAIISKDLQGRIMSWNAGAERIFGYKAHEMIGRHISALIPPVNLKEETEILDRIRRGERIDHFETVRIAKGGHTVDVSLTVSPIRNSDGVVIGASKIARDIRERKQIEEALRQAKENLEQMVADRTKQLRDAITDLEHFSYSISHDLRGPLRGISSFASILLNEYETKLEPEALNCVRRICAAAQRMDALMSDALEYCRVARADIRLAPVDLNQLLADTVLHSPQLQPDRLQLEVRGPLLPVLASEGLVTRCLSNLLANAVKFVAPGVTPSVTIWTEAIGDRVRVYVKDDGIGIPANDLERIWRIFERGHDRKRYEGTGVGLSLAKRAVERMGGTVGVDSAVGRGSTFWFELSAVEERPSPALNSDQRHDPGRGHSVPADNEADRTGVVRV